MMGVLSQTGIVNEQIAMPQQALPIGEDGTAFAQLLLMAGVSSVGAEASDQKAIDTDCEPQGENADMAQADLSPVTPITLPWTVSPSAIDVPIASPESSHPQAVSRSEIKPDPTENLQQKLDLPMPVEPTALNLPVRPAGLDTVEIAPSTLPSLAQLDRIAKPTIQTERTASSAANPMATAFQSAATILVGSDRPASPSEGQSVAAGDVADNPELDAERFAKAAPNQSGVDNVVGNVVQQSGQSSELVKPTAATNNLWHIAATSIPADARAVETLRAAAYFDALASDIAAAAISNTRTAFRISTDNLGMLGIGVDPSPTGMSVQIIAQGHEAAAVIAAAQPRLHEELRAQGVRMSEQQGQSFDRQPSNDRERPPQQQVAQPDRSPPEPGNRRTERRHTQPYRFA
jgi:hypothetical protein